MADTRADRTRASMREALMEMLKEMPFEDVTACALVERAGVSRSSFYNHYADMFELVEDCFASELQHFSRSFRRLRDYERRQDACADMLDDYARILAFLAENPNFARVLLDNFCTSPYFVECRAILERPLRDHIETEYGASSVPYLSDQNCVHYVQWGVIGLVREWFDARPRPSIEATSKEIAYCALQSIAGVVGRPIEPKYRKAINNWKLNA